MPRHYTHNLEEWARMLEKLADYTRKHRHTLYEKVKIKNKKNILDVGCGTGVITADIASLTDGHITGIDVDKKLEYAKSIVSDSITLMTADVLHLPFKDNTFDLVVFNLVLSHLNQQQEAVDEMARVTQEKGIVLATMEPDYAGGFSYPENTADRLFKKHFEERGIEMHTGRKLRYLFSKAGLRAEIGLCTDYFSSINEDSEEQAEKFLENFRRTKRFLSMIGWTEQQIQEFKQEWLELIESNLVFSFIPAFYAIGRK